MGFRDWLDESRSYQCTGVDQISSRIGRYSDDQCSTIEPENLEVFVCFFMCISNWQLRPRFWGLVSHLAEGTASNVRLSNDGGGHHDLHHLHTKLKIRSLKRGGLVVAFCESAPCSMPGNPHAV